MDLSDEAQQWFNKIKAEFAITDDAGLLLLQTAMEAFDEMRQAQKSMEGTGGVYQDRFGQPKTHPAAAQVSKSRKDMLQALSKLGLEIEQEYETKLTAL